jgi:hypothetical protein
MVNGQCRYEKAETKVSMCKVGLRFPIPEQGPMEGEKTWRAELDTLPRNFAISLSQTGLGKEKPFRPKKAGSGGNATYSITWNLDESSPLLRIERQEDDGNWVDITDRTVPVVVGKKMKLRGLVIPENKDPKKGTWTIDGKGSHLNAGDRNCIKRYEAHFKKGGKVIYLKPEDLNKQEVTFYWVDGGSGEVRYVTHVDEELSALAKFEIKRPNYQLTVTASDSTSVKNPYRGGKLSKSECWGQGAHGVVDKSDLVLQYDGIRFKAENLDKGEIDGKEQWVQIIKQEAYFLKYDDDNKTCWLITDALDVCYPYEHSPQAQDAPAVVLERDGKRLRAKHKTGGTSTKLAVTGKTQTNRMYLMF